jgi:hypothetical protein
LISDPKASRSSAAVGLTGRRRCISALDSRKTADALLPVLPRVEGQSAICMSNVNFYVIGSKSGVTL